MAQVRFEKEAPAQVKKLKASLGRLAADHSTFDERKVVGKFFVEQLKKNARKSRSTSGVTVVMISQDAGLIRHEPMPTFAVEDFDVVFETLTRMKDRKAPASLPTQEAELLDQAGFVENPLVAAVVMQQSKRELDAIMSPEGSLSMAEAQAALGVGASRLRQKLGAEKSLYGVKSGKSWRIPLFQFEPVKKGHKRTGARKLVRNIAKVLPSVDREASPLAVRRFFETENTDLVVGDDETPVTPLEWLGAGGAADVVAALAAEL